MFECKSNMIFYNRRLSGHQIKTVSAERSSVNSVNQPSTIVHDDIQMMRKHFRILFICKKKSSGYVPAMVSAHTFYLQSLTWVGSYFLSRGKQAIIIHPTNLSSTAHTQQISRSLSLSLSLIVWHAFALSVSYYHWLEAHFYSMSLQANFLSMSEAKKKNIIRVQVIRSARQDNGKCVPSNNEIYIKNIYTYINRERESSPNASAWKKR